MLKSGISVEFGVKVRAGFRGRLDWIVLDLGAGLGLGLKARLGLGLGVRLGLI